MSDEGLQQARDKMADAGVDATAIEVFSHYYRLVESGETGMIRESDIDPLDMDALADVDVGALLDRALAVRLRRLPPGPLDQAATRRVVSALVRQGFDAGAVFSRLRTRASQTPAESDD